MKFLQNLFQKRSSRRPKLKPNRRLRRAYLEQLETRELLANAIVAENLLAGSPASEWDIGQSVGDTAIQGYATDISVNKGETVSFKINDTALAPYSIDIYRIGYYQGHGARKVATIPANQTLVQSQPAPLVNASLGLVDAGNWSVSASWAVPSTAVSGVYIARLRRTDNGGGSHIIFVVRDDSGASDLLFQTSDTTWQAYNRWGGNSFYAGPFGGRAYALSYNRPFDTRLNTPKDWFFGPEYATVRWLEQNGYDVSYTTGVDTARRGAEILEHNVFLSVGHDEYWSQEQRANVEAARDAGVNLAFFSGNEIYWKTRWDTSIDASGKPFRTLISYKETWDDAKIDPLATVWTGTWRDPRFSPPADGGRPENALSGQIFTVNRGPGGDTGTPFEVPSDYAAMRFWRDTRVASLATGQVATVGDRVLGYEWDEDLDNGFRPAGLIRMSSTTQAVPEKIDEYGRRNTGSGQATHSLTLYRAESGALVFGAGTVNWGFGLDGVHDVIATTPDLAIQQATVNLFADMGVQPETLQAGLKAATMSTDVIAPVSTITSLLSGAILPAGVAVVLAGTASDQGGVVGGVEVSIDGGMTWRRAEGRTNWTYSFTPSRIGPTTLLTRAADDSGNVGTPVGISATVQVVPTSSTGLVAAYNFNQGSGTTLSDSSGRANNGSIAGATWTTGFSGGALSFNGTSDLVTIPDSNSLDLTTGMTVEAWVRPADSLGWSTIVAKESGTNNIAYSLYASDGTNQAPASYVRVAGVDKVAKGTSLLPLNTWSHVATTYDGAQLKFYVNGSLFSAAAVTGAITTSTNPLRIGGNTAYPDEYFRGLIDEVRIYNRSLTQAELQYDLSTPVGGTVDATPPTGSIASPSGTVSGTTTITVNAADNIAVAGVQILRNGQPQGIEITTSPFQVAWNTATVANGSYTLSARIRDLVGNVFTTPVVNVQVSNPADTSPPTLTLQYPEAGALVSGTTVLAAVGKDNVGVVGVRFQVDGTNLGVEDTIAPYRIAWNATSLTTGTHLVSAIARDAAGNLTTRSVSVVIDNTAPTLTARSPNPGAVNVSPGTVVTATFSEPILPASLAFQLENSAGVPVVASLSYDSATRTVTLKPQQDLQLGATYTARLTGGRDLAGNSLASSSWSFVTNATVANASFWNASVVPTLTSSTDTSSVELGVKFRSAVDGYITGLRFYKGTGNGGTHIGHLWSASGMLLATATFANETTTGWQQANFSAPVAITAGTTYVASYFAPLGRYAGDDNYFANGLTNGPLTILSSSAAGGNGVYKYSSTGAFPTDTYNATNYWVDVMFSNSVGDIVPPTLLSRSPAVNATSVATGSNITASFSEAIQSNNVTFQLRDVANNLVPASVTYNATTYTLTLDPTSNLVDFSTYTVSISGVQDIAGNALAPLSWTFATGGVDVTAPTITARNPTAGAINVAPSERVSATFSEAIDLNSLQVTLTDGANQSIPVGVFYDSVTNTAYVNLIPADGLPGGCCGACSHCPLQPSTFYTVRFAGAKDLSGNTMAPVTWSFTTADAVSNQSIWNSQAVPAVASEADAAAVELGVKFQTTAAGYITGLRFYKGATNTGTHVGHIWSSGGSVLGTATFSSETATGWQQVNFATPVFVTPGETYVASYYAPSGGYASSGGYFNAGGVSSGPLRLLANSEGGNGVYRYGVGGGFPNQSYNATNYWVDIVYANSLGDVIAPQIVSSSPAAGANNIAQTASITATFSEAIQSSTVSFVLMSSGSTVPATFSYNAATLTATITPSSPLAVATSYTATISGAKDSAGNTMTSLSWSFTTGGVVTNASLWNSGQTPALASAVDAAAIELGVKFASTRSGFITGLRFYRGGTNTGTHVGNLWTNNGTLLGTATFSQETGSGWQQVNFDLPIAITANTTYVASYYAPNGGYSVSANYFDSEFSSGVLRALSASASGGNGLYRYGTGGGFPTSSFSATNYWVDVVFSESLEDTTAPTLTSFAPASAAKDVATNSASLATFSEPVVPGTISFVLRDAGGTIVTANLTYDATTRTATLTPVTNLAVATNYTATLSGARDAAGNTLVTTSWSFKTLGVWKQSTAADFSTGAQSGTITTAEGDGALTMAPAFRDDFASATLGPSWQVSTWASGGTASITSGALGVQGSMVASTAAYTGQIIESRLTFGAAPYVHFGMATGLNSATADSWALFSTGGTTNTLFARVNVKGNIQDISLGAIPSGMHVYRIESTGTGFAFSIDGVLRTTIAIAFAAGTSSKITFSAYNTAASPALVVDWVSNPILNPTASYQSAVFDAGSAVKWQSASWTAQIPTGTSLQFEVSFSDNPSSAWTNWTTVTNGTSLGGVTYRYARYRVTFTSSALLAPTLLDTSLIWE